MVAIEQSRAIRQQMLRAMRKRKTALATLQRRQHRLMRDRAQRHDCRALREHRQLLREMAVALFYFARFRFVLRGQTTHGIRDAAIFQTQLGVRVVRRIQRFRARGKAKFMQRAIQQLARMVAGKRPPCAVRTVHPRRESDDQQGRTRLTKRWDRQGKIIGMNRLHLIQKYGEARA